MYYYKMHRGWCQDYVSYVSKHFCGDNITELHVDISSDQELTVLEPNSAPLTKREISYIYQNVSKQ